MHTVVCELFKHGPKASGGIFLRFLEKSRELFNPQTGNPAGYIWRIAEMNAAPALNLHKAASYCIRLWSDSLRVKKYFQSRDAYVCWKTSGYDRVASFHSFFQLLTNIEMKFDEILWFSNKIVCIKTNPFSAMPILIPSKIKAREPWWGSVT